MANDYEAEFDEETNIIEFLEWMMNNLHSFLQNRAKNGYPKKQPLREWIDAFLCWSEYEDNK